MNNPEGVDKQTQVEVAKITARTAIIVAIIAGLMGLLTGYITRPSGEPRPSLASPPADAGKVAINSFHRSVKDHPDDAWALIHPDRKAKVKPLGIVDANSFGATYVTTTKYRNLSVAFDKEDQTGARLYWVTFDAEDSLPYASLYQGLSRSMEALVADGVVNRDRLLGVVLADVRKQYNVPVGQIPEIERYVLRLPATAVLGPKIVSEIGGKFKLSAPSGLAASQKMLVWTRYIQHVVLREDNGKWKIVEGLFPSVLEAYYPSSVELPSLPGSL